jgi:hypothetical protein
MTSIASTNLSDNVVRENVYVQGKSIQTNRSKIITVTSRVKLSIG